MELEEAGAHCDTVVVLDQGEVVASGSRAALLAAGLAAVLWRELREFRKLRNWVSQTRLSDPPEAEGAWGDVFNSLHRHRRATLKRRRKTVSV